MKNRKCIHCGNKYNFEFKGHINAFSPILHYCEECIEKGIPEQIKKKFIKEAADYIDYYIAFGMSKEEYEKKWNKND